jgi:signal transduction histidine kinase
MMKRQLLFILLLSLFNEIHVSAQNAQHEIDSAKRQAQLVSKNDSAFVQTCFYLADTFMGQDQYDSAQLWLNKIHERMPLKKPSLFTYFLQTRQAEVYYYNNLQQLGLQETNRALQTATTLNDSLLLADSYNFAGLFYMNLDSSKKAILFYKEGIRYAHQTPYPAQYISLSKPHHLYGNMGEAYIKLKMYDSALLNIRISLQKATEINWERGIAVAHNNAGIIFFETGYIDSAIQHYTAARKVSQHSADFDVELLTYSGMAACFDKQDNYATAKTELDKGFEVLHQKPQLNRFFALQFLTTAVELYRKHNDDKLLVNALEMRSAIETANVRGNNAQIQTILNAGLENEKRLLNLEITEVKQKQELTNTRLLVALIAIAFLTTAFLVYRYKQNQKLSLAKVRNKISQDLHDDIGASLSSLQIYGAIAEKTITEDPPKAKEMMYKIAVQSRQLMENMNDIVWSMKTNDVNTTSLVAKIKNYGADLLNEKNIVCHYNILPETEHSLQTIKARKNILLIIKEAMNNIAKYSNATEATIDFRQEGTNLVLIISDNGTGFNAGSVKKGNGLTNMQQRIQEINGNLIVEATPGKGTVINAVFPLAAINDTGW